MGRRSAFTLVELVVVCGIIVVLLSIMLSSLQGAREAARRIQCMNNLKQLHLGLQSYHANHRVFPPGAVGDVRPLDSTSAGLRIGWPGMILPFVEQSSLYDTLNFDLAANSTANLTTRATSMNAMVCPDAQGGEGRRPSGPASAEPPFFGRSSYAACHHDLEKAVDVDDHGIMFLNSRVRIDDVFDGLSQTILLGEVYATVADGYLVGGRATLRNTGTAINLVDFDPRAAGDGGGAEAWLSSGRTPGDLETLAARGEIRLPGGYVGGFGSRHRGGGAVFTFGDGSTRFVRQSVDPVVFRRLGNRDDGEEITDESY